jgi:hypothetical protein
LRLLLRGDDAEEKLKKADEDREFELYANELCTPCNFRVSYQCARIVLCSALADSDTA